MALIRTCGGAGTSHRYIFGVRVTSSGQALYPDIYIPVSELAGKTKVKVTVLNKSSDITVYNNGTSIAPIDNAYSAGTSVNGTVDTDMTIPSMSGYDFLRISATVTANGSGTTHENIILEAILS